MLKCPNTYCNNCTDFILYTSIAVRIDGDLNITQSVNLRTSINFFDPNAQIKCNKCGQKGPLSAFDKYKHNVQQNKLTCPYCGNRSQFKTTIPTTYTIGDIGGELGILYTSKPALFTEGQRIYCYQCHRSESVEQFKTDATIRRHEQWKKDKLK